LNTTALDALTEEVVKAYHMSRYDLDVFAAECAQTGFKWGEFFFEE
jgi:hypothetical protein